MKKMNKKGFTMVELVIVIAVIAILAGVLIPTFSNVVEKAKDSKALQEARSAYEAWLVDQEFDTLNYDKLDFYIKSGDNYYEVKDGQFNEQKVTTNPTSSVNIINGSLDLEYSSLVTE